MKIYECLMFKQTAKVKDDEEVPICSDKKMKNMPREIDIQPKHAEHARTMEEETSCNEFREG